MGFNSNNIGRFDIPRALLATGLARARHTNKVVIAGERVARAETFAAEMTIRRVLLRLAAAEPAPIALPDMTGLHELQAEAVKLACERRVLVLTGGGGVGKSHTTKTIVTAWAAAGLTVKLVAPTGKAAQRLAEATGLAAGTIHRALGIGKDGRAETTALDYDCVVIDETSMCGVGLLASLLGALKTDGRLLLIGDPGQLPSISAGRCLGDILASGSVPSIELTHIFRQAAESRIPYVSRDVRNGRQVADLEGHGTDFRFVEQNDPDVIFSSIMNVVQRLPKERGCSADDIQVISPQKKGPLGTMRLNHALQAVLNGVSSIEDDVAAGYATVRTGDRVIHVKNNYDLGVFNGDLGYVLASSPNGVKLEALEKRLGREINWSGRADLVAALEERGEDASKLAYPADRVLLVEFVLGSDRRLVAYGAGEARELELAYALTVHKLQGSAAPYLIGVCSDTHRYMLTRELLYTMITRAAKYAMLIGDQRAFQRGVATPEDGSRRTQLLDMLRTADDAFAAEHL